jgi:hypothetical protein
MSYSLITKEHIDNFSNRLTKILNSELMLGNEVVETAKDWPYKGSIMIFLNMPFLGGYNVENVDYRDVDDIHYWKAEYFDNITKDILACRFDMTKLPPK